MTMATLQHDELLDRIAALESENASLKTALASCIRTEQHDRLIAEYNELSSRFKKLEKKHIACRPYIDTATRQYKAAKESAKQWKRYHESKHWKQYLEYTQQQKDATKGTVPPPVCDHGPIANQEDLPAGPDSERTPRPLVKHSNLDGIALQPHVQDAPEQPSHPALELGDNVDTAQQQATAPRDLEIDILCSEVNNADVVSADATVPPHEHLKESMKAESQHVTSSQSTEAGSDPALLEQTRMSSDDEPEVVLARSVKRRRGNSPRRTL